MCYVNVDFGGFVYVGYWFGEFFWGQGFVIEVVYVLVDYVFMYIEIEELQGLCCVINLVFWWVLVKFGFQFCDQFMIWFVGVGGFVLIEWYMLEWVVWKFLKGWGQE